MYSCVMKKNPVGRPKGIKRLRVQFSLDQETNETLKKMASYLDMAKSAIIRRLVETEKNRIGL